MRPSIIAGNWKMHKTIQETESFMDAVCSELPTLNHTEVIIAPPFTNISTVVSKSAGGSISCAAQTVSEHVSGAYTGDVSAEMIQASGCSHVIIGHSERRQYHDEKNPVLNQKIALAHKHALIPIYCIGETLEQREQGQTLLVLESQLREGLKDLSLTHSNLIIAYEPVWAIGTGKVATAEQAQEIHHFIRSFLSETFSDSLANSIRILYGGSVKPSNVKELLSEPDIDGALVGGASLESESFLELIRLTNQ